jgi:hypothetical protein
MCGIMDGNYGRNYGGGNYGDTILNYLADEGFLTGFETISG